MSVDNVSPDDYTVVWTAASMVEAQLARAALDEAGIAAITDDFDVNPYDGVWVPQQGWAKIRVSPDDAQRALDIIKEALDAQPLDDEANDEHHEP